MFYLCLRVYRSICHSFLDMYSPIIMNSSSRHKSPFPECVVYFVLHVLVFIPPLCLCFCFSPVSDHVLSLVRYPTVFTWTVFGSWLVCLLIYFVSVCSPWMSTIVSVLSKSYSLCPPVLVEVFSLCLWLLVVYFAYEYLVCWNGESTKTSMWLVAADLQHYFIKIHCSPFLSPKTVIAWINDSPWQPIFHTHCFWF